MYQIKHMLHLKFLIILIILLTSCTHEENSEKIEHRVPWTGFSLMDDGSYEYINYRYQTKEECLIKTRWKVVVDPDDIGRYKQLPLNKGDPIPKNRIYKEGADYGCAYRSNSLIKSLYHYVFNHHKAFECLFESYDPYQIFDDFGKYKPMLFKNGLKNKYGKCKF